MDSLTHIVMGAALAQAVGYKTFGKKALVFGALAATIPDFDILAMPFLGPFAEWKYHRAVTHSLWFAPLIGTLMGWGLWHYYGRKGHHLRIWIGMMIAAMLSHPLLDACTIYGTQLLAPFSNQRFEISAISIIDPVYTLVLLTALLLPIIPRLRPYRKHLTCAALIFSVLYIGYGWQQNNIGEYLAKKRLESQGVQADNVTAYTTIFQPYLRRIVVQENDGDTLRVGFVSTLSPQPIIWSCQQQAPQDVRKAILSTEEGQILHWFSGYQLNITLSADKKTAAATDARYGVPGPSLFGWWGLSFKITYNPDGKVTAASTGRIQMERDGTIPAIKGLFLAAYGLENDFLAKTENGCNP